LASLLPFPILTGWGCAAFGTQPPPPGGGLPPAVDAIERELLRKAHLFHEEIAARHLTREGLFLYTVDLDQIDRQLAGGEVPALSDTPTYTGLFTAMSCMRAQVTSGSERSAALADAERGLSGLELLMRVTGRPGLLARGVQRGPVPLEPARPHHRWFPGAPGYEQFVWRGDASQDQYANGLLPAVASCRELFPERTGALVRAAAELLDDTGMMIVDPDGRRTLYGDLSPRSGFGFNAIAKLTGYGVFALASELDADPRWRARRDRLRDVDRVVATSLRTNLRILGITNFSNDMMAWNLYRVLIPLARRTEDPALASLEEGMQRAWRRVRPDQNAYFSLLYCQLRGEDCPREPVAVALDILARFPVEKRRVAPSPDLAQLPRAWIPGRHWHPRARSLVPIELRPPESFEWKANPYRVTAPTLPQIEYTGLDYLVAYWLYRTLAADQGS